MAYKTRDGKWMCDLRPRVMGIPTGKRVRKLMPKVKTRAEAEEEERRILREIQMELSGERRVSPPFEEYARGEYLRYVRGNKKRPEDDERRLAPLVVSPHFAGKRLDDITPDDVERYKAERRSTVSRHGRRLAPGSVNIELAALSAIFRQAISSGKARSNPVLGVRYVRREAHRLRILRHDEEARLLEVLASSRGYLLPLVRVALLTGMRLSELLRLRAEDVDFGRNVLYVRDPKWHEDKRKTEGLPFSAEVRGLLLSLKVRRGLFFSTPTGARIKRVSVSVRFGYLARRAGLDGLTFHSLRHTFGTRLAKEGYSLQDIAKLLGHSSTTMTMRYVHPSEEDLREAVESLSRRPRVVDFEKADSRRQEA